MATNPMLNSSRDLSTNAQPVSDESLLIRYRDQHDNEAFAELVRRYERDLHCYLSHYVGDANVAEDVFQQTFLQVHQKCHLFDQQRSFRPWLYAIATHQAIDLSRRTRRHPTISLDLPLGRTPENNGLIGQLESPLPGPESLLEAREQREHVRQAMATLPRRQRVALKLIYFRGMRYQEAAERLRVPIGTLKTRVHSALATLKPMARAS